MDHPTPDAPGREAELGRAFVRFADTLVSDYDVVDLLDDLAQTCATLLDVEAAGIMLRRGDRLELAAATSQDIRDLEVFQVQTDEGPCRDCVRSGEPLSIPDLTALDGGRPWPRFTQAALRRGVRAVHAIPLRLRAEVIGGLNMFRTAAYAWNDSDTTIARALADVATIGILHDRAARDSAQLQSQLQRALDSRILVEQAKGMLAAQADVTPDEAFAVLRTFCRNNNLQLRATAQLVVAGQLDLTAMRGQRR